MQDIPNIQEQRQFSNPNVRFRRINGRVVPFVNKQKVGEKLKTAGSVMMGAGAIGIGTHFMKKTEKFKKMSGLFSNIRNSIVKNPHNLPVVYNPNIAKIGKMAKVSTMSKVMNRAGRFAKFSFRHAGVMGALAVGAGLYTAMKGHSMKLDSDFGEEI